MLDGLTPDLAPRLVLAIGGVGVALVILVLVLIFLKRRNSPLFIKGGKAREPRLMVLDAAAIDPKRRLVLIRRDDVEHLIMIGGPTDIVIETGITDRSSVAANRSVPVDEARPVAAPAAEVRQALQAAERKLEAVRPATPVQTERPVPAPVEARAASPATSPVARAATPPVNVPERTAPSIDRYMERPAVERQPETRNVSAMGSVLYNEDREPMTGAKPVRPAADAAVVPSIVKRPEPVEAAPTQPRIQPLPSAAEAVLDAARDRVLPNQQPAPPTTTVTVSDAERALAARMEAMRRVQSAQPTATSPIVTQPVTRPAVQPAAQQTEADVDLPKLRDEPSDFEKLLEAELDASGVFGSQPPQVRGDSRVTNAVATSAITPPVRVTPPITGATPDVSSEEEVARLLGEIAINRKP